MQHCNYPETFTFSNNNLRPLPLPTIIQQQFETFTFAKNSQIKLSVCDPRPGLGWILTERWKCGLSKLTPFLRTARCHFCHVDSEIGKFKNKISFMSVL